LTTSDTHQLLLNSYLEMMSLIERVHRGYLDLISRELARIGSNDIKSVPALILLNIGEAKLAISEMGTRCNYLGANIAYIAKKLIENGYLLHERSADDRRVVDIWLTDKGRILCERLAEMHAQYNHLSPEPESNPDLERAVWTLRQIEQLCIDQELGP
jgi:DNA-binding MarR family transcriptional regulator